MRFIATALVWIVATILVAVAVPAMWVQQNLVSQSGYAALAERAAKDPAVQSAMADELTAQVGRFGTDVDGTFVRGIAGTYTASSVFPGQFAQANVFAHRWLFTNTVASGFDVQGRWVIDLAPMLSDPAFAQTLRDYRVLIPAQVPIPLTENAPAMLRPGALSLYGRWAPVLAWGVAILAAGAAVLVLLVARGRGKALVALGVSGLVVGAAGWVGVEYGQRHLARTLEGTSGSVRTVIDGLVAAAQNSLHQWLNITIVVGGGLVIVGVIVSLLAGVVSASGAGKKTPART